jgi:hypothetical protein
MIHLVRDTQGEDGEGLGAVSDFSHIPAPSEATWVGEWRFFKGCCPEHQDWLRYFGGRSWTVEFFCDHVEVEIAGAQFSDGSTDRWICVDGDYHSPSADEALMLAATLSSAADELQRIEGGPMIKGDISNATDCHSGISPTASIDRSAGTAH